MGRCKTLEWRKEMARKGRGKGEEVEGRGTVYRLEEMKNG